MMLALAAMTSCHDEIDCPVPDVIEPGLPATIKLQVSMPAMSVVSRAAMSDADASKINSLWIGIYDDKGNRKAGSGIISLDDATKKDDGDHPVYTVNIETTTGPSKVVAVANVKGNNGVSMLDGDSGAPQDLADLLENADTWEKYTNISLVLPTAGDISTPLGANLPMSGFYAASITSHDGAVWETLEPSMIDIMAVDTKALPIHMRRLVSHVNVKLEMAGEEGNVASITPYSYKVYNVPRLSWLHERNSKATGTSAMPNANAGDHSKTVTGSSGNYDESHVYTAQYFTTTGSATGNDKVVSFDFYMLENKRRGLSGCNKYTDREREVKNGDGTNSGIYVSLVGETGSKTDVNNNAAYMEIKCHLKLKDIEDSSVEGGKIFREADAIYVVHLGYCEGSDEAEKSKDFNCRRNTRYTYNIKLKDVDKILVEAKGESESQPGAEGMVTDVSSRYVELDCHYAAFNIKLTKDQRSDGKFKYKVRTFDKNWNTIDIDGPGAGAKIDNSRYKWVEFRATSSQDVLARYLPYGEEPKSDDTNKSKTFRLEDLKDVDTYQPLGDSEYYTVFIDEYAYDDLTWKDYVNLPDRKVWLRLTEDFSLDKESSHYNSMYCFSQKSIQTYYDPATTVEDAIGVEHTNETLGLNMCYVSGFTGGTGLLDSNGLENTKSFLNYIAGNSDRPWNIFVDFTSPQLIGEINRQGYRQDAVTRKNAVLPKSVSAKTQGNHKDINVTLKGNATDPQPDATDESQFIYAFNACMNRNRDLNGNGIIDDDEIQWYIPANGKYLRAIIGRNSLTTPIMDYAVNQLEKDGSPIHSRFHFFTSYKYIIQCEEGLTELPWKIKEGVTSSAEYGQDNHPWQVRCVRNLTKTSTQNPNAAYDIGGVVSGNPSSSEGEVEMKYYNRLSLRNNTSQPLPVHYINDVVNNRPPYKFEYAGRDLEVKLPELDPGQTDPGLNKRLYDYLENNNPCAELNQTGDMSGWRVPNQKELAILRTGGVRFFSLNVTNPFAISCTREYYDDKGVAAGTGTHRFIGSNGNVMGVLEDKGNYTLVVRCVRDIIQL